MIDMKNVRYILLILTILSGCAVSAQEVSMQEQFENELKLKNKSVTSIKCHFVQKREMSVFQNVIRKEGTFFFQYPGNMLLSFNDGDYIKMTEDWFEMRTGENTSATKVSSNPMLRSLGTVLSACVVGNFEQLTKWFSIHVEQEKAEWIVFMTPQRGKSASKISRIILHFDRENMSLNILKMEEMSGDYTLYCFSDKKFNETIDSQLFRIVE